MVDRVLALDVGTSSVRAHRFDETAEERDEPARRDYSGEHDPDRVVRIMHMGFVLRTDAGLVVRHASTGTERAVLDEPWDAFVQRQREYKKWKVIGVALARPLDASRRVARIQTAQR